MGFTAGDVRAALAEQEALPPSLDCDRIAVYDEIDSTNSELLRRIQTAGNLRERGPGGALRLTAGGKLLHGQVAAAASQTAGRGRMGRAFYSPVRSGIYFSLCYVPADGVEDPARYTIAAAVGVCRAIRRVFGGEPQIKWVNDVYLRGKKVCGILTEGVAGGSGAVDAVVIGIGINIRMEGAVPGMTGEQARALLGNAGGILDGAPEAGTGAAPPDARAPLLAACLRHILGILDSGEHVIPEYRARSLLAGRRLTVTPVIGNAASFPATALDITDDGGLLVQLADGSRRILRSGEVTLHEPHGIH